MGRFDVQNFKTHLSIVFLFAKVKPIMIHHFLPQAVTCRTSLNQTHHFFTPVSKRLPKIDSGPFRDDPLSSPLGYARGNRPYI